MDAIDFIKQVRRMDKEKTRTKHIFDAFSSPEDVVTEVEQWAKENPAKTRQSKFLKQWPNADRYEDGTVAVCPNVLICGYKDSCSSDCNDCCRDFWNEEVE